MVKSPIKTYARLKPSKNPSAHTYTIEVEEGVEGERRESLLISTHSSSGQEGKKQYKFRFTQVFDRSCSQKVVFDNVAKPILEGVLRGFNGTIFAYGQTGTGKTYSISGEEGPEEGMAPRAFDFLIRSVTKRHGDKFAIWMSFMEIYNELAYDLLSEDEEGNGHHGERVSLIVNKRGEVEVRNLIRHRVRNMRDVKRLMEIGTAKRAMADTAMNEYSSRSHCVVVIHLLQGGGPGSPNLAAKLHLVDLAGSEQMKTTSHSSQIFQEARHINLSLHYLEQVIVALANPRRKHVPYRNSVITCLLKDSLGGNCNTAMLATVSLEPENFTQTVATCRFAQRVALVKTTAICNQGRDPAEEVIWLKRELERLRSLIGPKKIHQNFKEKNFFKIHNYDFESMMNVIENEISHLKSLGEESCRLLNRNSSDLKTLANFLKINLPKVNAKTGEAYKCADRKKFEAFLSKEGGRGVRACADLCSGYYKELEKEWRLYRKTQDTCDSLDHLHKMKSNGNKGWRMEICEEIKSLKAQKEKQHRKLEWASQSRERKGEELAGARERVVGGFNKWLEAQLGGKGDGAVEGVYPTGRNEELLPTSDRGTESEEVNKEEKRIPGIAGCGSGEPPVLVKAVVGNRVFWSKLFNAMGQPKVKKEGCPGYGRPSIQGRKNKVKAYRKGIKRYLRRVVTVQIGRKEGEGFTWVSCKLLENMRRRKSWSGRRLFPFSNVPHRKATPPPHFQRPQRAKCDPSREVFLTCSEDSSDSDNLHVEETLKGNSSGSSNIVFPQTTQEHSKQNSQKSLGFPQTVKQDKELQTDRETVTEQQEWNNIDDTITCTSNTVNRVMQKLGLSQSSLENEQLKKVRRRKQKRVPCFDGSWKGGRGDVVSKESPPRGRKMRVGGARRWGGGDEWGEGDVEGWTGQPPPPTPPLPQRISRLRGRSRSEPTTFQ